MERKRKLSFRRVLSLIVAVAMVFTLVQVHGVMVAKAAAGDTPAHTKLLTDNGDGTYTLSLDVVGESERKPNNVNVIVILDRSGSMSERTGGQTRMVAARNAVNNLARSLFAYNNADAPDTVEMALVSFATQGGVSQNPTTSYTTFSNAVNGLTANGGTNWEDALNDAAGVNFGDNDQTFAIFVSDGNPTFRVTQNGYNDWSQRYQAWGNGQETTQNIARCYETAVPAAQALAEAVTPDNFFTIGAYGNVDRMQSLTTDAGAPAGNYFSAADTAGLQAALTEILARIEMSGLNNVEIDDGTTNQVTTSSGDIAELLEVDTSSFKYYRSGGSYGVQQEWADAPDAELVNGEVQWDLSGVGVLENGVRYTVTFDVYPSQYTYDTIAKLKNGDLQYSELDSEVQKYIVDNGGGNYSLRTNTNATLTYEDTRTDEGEQSVGYTNPDPVGTEADQLTIKKFWEGADAPDVTLPITVLMDGDEFHTAELSGPDWEASSYISIGIIKNGQALPGAEGHDFSFAELDDTQYRWELDAPTVHPMHIGNAVVMLIKVDDEHPAPSGADTYTIKGAAYYADPAATGLEATNYRRSNLNLSKTVTGEDAPEDAAFPFTLTVNNSKAPASAPADDTEHNSDYWVWFSIYDTKAGATVTDATVSGATGPSADGYYYAPSGSAISVEMKDGWNLRFTNLPTGTTYTFAEGTLEDGFAFSKAELSGVDSTFSGGQTTTGTIENVSTTYIVNYTNDYQLTNLEITKVWEDSSNQDGIRPAAEKFADYLTLSPAVEGAVPTIVDNEDETYTITYTGLPRFNNGQEVEYTVAESAIDGYTTQGSPAKDHGTITNTHEPEVIDITVVKEWDDSDNIGKIRPASIQAQLTADGTASGDPVTLNEGNQWTYTWEGLPKFKEGTEINYSADETSVPTGYKKEGPEKVTADDGTVTITVTNVYNPTSVIVDPPVQKIIENNDDLYNKGNFTFTITGAEGAPMPENTSITNSADYELATKKGFYEFGEIEFTQPGTYTYTVKESGSADGVTNDPAAAEGKTLTFTVTDDGTGTLVVSPTTDQVQLSFTNTYDASGEATITAAKEVKGAAWPAGKTLTFTLTGEDGAPMPETATAQLTAAGEVEFGPIAYALADAGKTYTYTISEGDGFGEGWTGSGDITATVEVTDKGDGTLDAAVTYDPEGAVITNTYKAEGEATIEVTKVVEGAAWPAGKTLTLTLQGDGPLPETTEVTLTAAGKATFGPIAYSEADAGKEYTYTVSENGFGAGWSGSDDITATVTVTDKGDGTLEAAVTYDPEGAVITNTYKAAGSIVLEANKTLTGREWKDGETVTFTLLDPNGEKLEEKTIGQNGLIEFAPIEYTEADAGKEYTYTISETSTLPGGVTKSADIKATVTVTDNGDGTLKTEAAYTEQDTIINTYTASPVKATINVSKNIDGYIEGTDANGNKVDRTFTFTMKGPKIDGELTTSITTEGGTGTAAFDEIEFTFDDMKDEDGNQVAEKVFTYEVTETAGSDAGFTYDDETYTVNVTVKDNQEGKLEVTDITKASDSSNVEIVNTFEETSVDVVLHVTKLIDDQSGSAQDKTFTFQLLDENGEMLQEKQITTEELEGQVDFDALTFTAAGTYNYTMQEIAPAEEGEGEAGEESAWTYDTKAYPVVITVSDNFETAVLEGATTIDGESTTSLTITNVYKAISTEVTLAVTKEVDDTSGSAYETTFEFTLADADGNVISTAQITGPGTAEFDPITYERVGEYNYTITETQGNAAAYIYDTTDYPVVVTVVDENEKLAATVAYGEKSETSLTVTNTYDPKDAKATPQARKVIEDTSGSAPDEEFTFQLTDESGEVVETVTGKAGYVYFSEMTFAKIGTYSFTITEVAGNNSAFTYDTAERALQIEVTDPDKDGKLKAAITYQTDEGEAVITNRYEPVPTSAQIEVSKELNGMNEGVDPVTFTFTLSGPDADQTVSITGSGTAAFEAIEYTKVGTYTYTVTETNDAAPGYTYDDAVYTVEIKVTDEGGKLAAAQTITKDSQNASGIVFVNTYEAKPVQITFDASKKLTGRDLKDGEFSFTAKVGDQSYTAVNDASGIVTFSGITFTAPGSYTIEVTEDAGSLGGVTYDPASFTVTAEVTDNGDGTLSAAVSGADGIEFVNTYETKAVEVELKAAKQLTGRELKKGEFNFTVSQGDTVYAKGTNDKDGNIVFEKIELVEAGTYKFTLQEVKGDDKYVSYDTNKYEIEVVVEDDGNGNLVVKTPAEGNTGVVFKNAYNPPVPPDVPKTGDSNHTGLWAILLAVAAAAAIGFAVIRRRRNA